MCRTVRVLSATALACAALGAAATAASADPGAEVDPRSVGPGGLLSISVTCDAIGGTPPESIDAHSQGFEGGTVQLHRITGGDEKTDGATSYRGTARIPASGTPDAGSGAVDGSGGVGGFGVASAAGEQFTSDSVDGDREAQWGVNGVCPVAPGGQERPWNASYTVSHGTGTGASTGTGTGTGASTGTGIGTGTGTGTGASTGTGTGTGTGPGTGTSAGRDTATGRETGAPHDTGVPHDTGAGRDTGAAHDTGTGRDPGTGRDTGATHETGTDHDSEERPTGAQYGVQGGAGGTFTDSVPALITGGVLIVGALGAALHRLRQRGSSHR
ncbi:hypothetical protein OG258_42110 [Streptomyces mirabilis]|uniref:hypothetical protein n=1 Tax=Streptomyces mirabilis TaxID=68239 RepID=UPI002E2DB566|nr:hypothetical protein [Streptomyces mirabilis]